MLRSQVRVLAHAIHLEIEPGRYQVAESGVLVAEARATKRMGKNHFVLVDAVDGSERRLIRRRQTLDELLALERVHG